MVNRNNQPILGNNVVPSCRKGIHGTTTILRRFVCPGVSSWVPWTATTVSPDTTRPSSFALAIALAITESVPTNEAVSIGRTPRLTSRYRRVDSLAVIAKMVAWGRYLASATAVLPVSVRATINLQPESTAALTADEHSASTEFIKPSVLLF
eukprot:CAMPEP_0172707590 /NCGR_PEP_ID=MMETSP1074-20121228/50061_1 /TAXON_ID=2916 /ORGANISM="Ceratium fusus, Strain PA161109" /LENGTH=151 /DNA_ID=CAMNT_0013530423 /DNA_START=22 /DNA_END=474 /DNA_ORIENTATION=-